MIIFGVDEWGGYVFGNVVSCIIGEVLCMEIVIGVVDDLIIGWCSFKVLVNFFECEMFVVCF